MYTDVHQDRSTMTGAKRFIQENSDEDSYGYMKTKIFKLEATAEINEICCNIYDATLNICVYDGKELKVTLPDCKNVNVAVGEKSLIINQAKRLFNLGKQVIEICVPTHILTDLSITGNHAKVNVDGGIYADLSLNGVCGELNVNNCAFASMLASCSQLDVNINETTVKQNLLLQINKGQLVLEKCFALIADCRLKMGNMGLINLSGNDLTFETESGNIALTIDGCEEEYNTLIRVKNGTSNKPSIQNDGAIKSVKAFTENGNVVIDFVGEKVVCEVATADDTIEDTLDDSEVQSEEERTL